MLFFINTKGLISVKKTSNSSKCFINHIHIEIINILIKNNLIFLKKKQ